MTIMKDLESLLFLEQDYSDLQKDGSEYSGLCAMLENEDKRKSFASTGSRLEYHVKNEEPEKGQFTLEYYLPSPNNEN